MAFSVAVVVDSTGATFVFDFFRLGTRDLFTVRISQAFKMPIIINALKTFININRSTTTAAKLTALAKNSIQPEFK